MQSFSAMTGTTHMRRYRMVVGVDLTEYSEIVLEHALDQAARHSAPELHIIHVRERAQRKRSLEELRQRARTPARALGQARRADRVARVRRARRSHRDRAVRPAHAPSHVQDAAE